MRCLTLATALLLISTTAAVAKRQRRPLPPVAAAALSRSDAAARFQQKMQRMVDVPYGPAGAMLKTTAGGVRLIAEAAYDFSMPPGSQTEDSLVLLYSGSRTSAFDFEYLSYNYDNYVDEPSSFGIGGYVNFDTLRVYDRPGSTYTSPGVRTYHANGKIDSSLRGDNITLFTYNAQNRVAKSIVLSYNSTTSSWDSSYRDFYSYSPGGQLLRDSSESWNPFSSQWEPSLTAVFTTNAAGLPAQTTTLSYSQPVPEVLSQMNFSYNASNLPILTIMKFTDNAGGLINASKDSMAYTGTTLTYHDGYWWDDVAGVWDNTYNERRHLNTASLPDSVWSRSGFSGWADTTIQKLVYNAQGNPLTARTKSSGSSGSYDIESRYYYEAFSGVGIPGTAMKQNLAVYPNPVTDLLYLKNVPAGTYRIQNMAGQLMQSGTLQHAAGIPAGMLAPGVYSLSLQDNTGVIHTARFVRQ